MCNANDISNKHQQGFLGGTSEKRLGRAWLTSLLIPGSEGISGGIEIERYVSGDSLDPAKEKQKNRDRGIAEGYIR